MGGVGPARRGLPRRQPVKSSYVVRLGGDRLEVVVEDAGGTLAVSLGGSTYRVDAAEVVPGWLSLLVDGRSHRLVVVEPSAGVRRPDAPAGRWRVLLDAETYDVEVGRSTRTGGGPGRSTAHAGDVRAPMPGLVVALPAAAGLRVESGQPLVIMEAMKMQMEVRAPRAGTVRQIHVAAGQEVAGGQLLATLE